MVLHKFSDRSLTCESLQCVPSPCTVTGIALCLTLVPHANIVPDLPHNRLYPLNSFSTIPLVRASGNGNTHSHGVPLLDDKIDILKGNAAETLTTKRVFRIVATALALVRLLLSFCAHP